jgi:hypothetical protein
MCQWLFVIQQRHQVVHVTAVRVRHVCKLLLEELVALLNVAVKQFVNRAFFETVLHVPAFYRVSVCPIKQFAHYFIVCLFLCQNIEQR